MLDPQLIKAFKILEGLALCFEWLTTLIFHTAYMPELESPFKQNITFSKGYRSASVLQNTIVFTGYWRH